MQAPEPNQNDVTDFKPLFGKIQERVPGFSGDIQVERIGGGQSNPTYFLTSDHYSLVLRKRPAGINKGAAHDVLREFTLMETLGPSAIPVPKVYFYSDDLSVVGTDFYIMDRVPSRQFFDGCLQEIPAEERPILYQNLATQLARLHQFQWRGTALRAYCREGDFLDRQISRWSRAFNNSDEYPDACRVQHYLSQHKPVQHSLSLIHGDYKFSNLLIHPSRPEISAIIDWELATIGDPLTDLAHTWASLWGTKPEEYGGLWAIDCKAYQVPTEDEFLASYFRQNPIATEMPVFYKVLALFRYAGIFQGIKQREQAGLAASATAKEVSKLGRVYLDRALAYC